MDGAPAPDGCDAKGRGATPRNGAPRPANARFENTAGTQAFDALRDEARPARAERAENVMSELTPELRAAAESDDVEAIDALIETGADPNGKNYAGNTALHAAATQGVAQKLKLVNSTDTGMPRGSKEKMQIAARENRARRGAWQTKEMRGTQRKLRPGDAAQRPEQARQRQHVGCGRSNRTTGHEFGQSSGKVRRREQ